MVTIPAELAPRELSIHGHRVRYRQAGDGPLLLLLHGITGRSEQWLPVMGLLAKRFTVLTPDLLGHGESAKPRGDYSLGAYASGVRDLAGALGHHHGTVVGHSLGGGIAMQFAYQFPSRVGRLVLVDSGGLGREVSLLLRAATLPGSELALALMCAPAMRDAGAWVGRALARLGITPGADLAAIAGGLGSLGAPDAREAFLHTARSILDLGGQRVDARDRLYLAEQVPTLIVWGDRDPMIPIAHGEAAHRLIAGSRLEVFAGAGHFPHHDDPLRFVRVLEEFVEQTEPAHMTDDDARELILARG